ncbi:hypothetical protein HS7_05050 [Sulfolobales archaeon HS-7]|nr:hypothetical protein HS7_05050 [Sulfolobales archaeon HS-7]
MLHETLIPFYECKNILVDAYFPARVEHIEERIFLIRDKLKTSYTGNIEHMPWDELINLFVESKKALERRDHWKSLTATEVLASMFYNPSFYISRREHEINLESIRRMYLLFYNRFLSVANDCAPKRVWGKLAYNNIEVYIDDEKSIIYTKLFKADGKFHAEVRKLLGIIQDT